ncbi:T3SS effector HopA1 family protein [Crocosphaera sp. XPORK-15E]|uniref:T3SS effector HopA1 family protein n=1 Tax=Crocosphaera sp. XPORK-15E TaxID=3110247 RepID=UPI002B1E9705|nr:T3SS effector HopA1 family protein [Crocosphaera sp. XPORK-15E]MEA5535808.1 T3SS effector HopA1 family protein [Crocosphaera sp. XPORK-15E]
MQSLDSLLVQQSNKIGDKLLQVLTDIVNKVEIKPNFSIRHPNYKPFELPAEVVCRFENLPEQIKQKYLSLQLQSFLYGIYYNGSMRTDLALDKETDNRPINLENNTFLGVDLEFYDQLHQSNQGEGYFDSGWLILKEEEDGGLTVSKGDLNLYIERDKYLQTFEKSAVVGDLVAIKMPKNLVQNGFYMAVGNEGHQTIKTSPNESVIVRIYFNLTPPGSIKVMASLTQQLNNLKIPFSFKVLYNPEDYQRYDSGVLYFDKENYQKIKVILENIYHEHQGYFKPEIPLFTLEIAPGLGLAEEPDKKFFQKESFGMNRCQIIANGLLKAWYNGDNSPEGRMKAIFEQFSQLSIDLQYSYLNSESENIYDQVSMLD